MGEGDGEEINYNEIVVCNACCCCYDGLYCGESGNPLCCCRAVETLCCLEGEFCLYRGAPMLCCVCCEFHYVSPTVCLRSEAQVCCCVCASAVPCDEEVPCIVGLLSVVCYPGCFYQKKRRMITGKEAPPQVEETCGPTTGDFVAKVLSGGR